MFPTDCGRRLLRRLCLVRFVKYRFSCYADLCALLSVNVFYRVNQEPLNPNVDRERAKQEKEFKIGSIGLADSLGILAASLLAVPAEVGLCRAQVGRGKMLCKQL